MKTSKLLNSWTRILFMGLVLALNAQISFATEYNPFVEVERHRDQIDFTVEGIVTPKVVKMQTGESLSGPTILLPKGAERRKENLIHHQVSRSWEKRVDKIPVTVTSFSSIFEGGTGHVTDGNYGTYLGFDSSSPLHSLTFRFDEPTEVSRIFITLGKGVLPPKRMSVEGVFENGEENAILRSVPFRPFMSWPPVKVTELRFRMTSPHLLRIAEVDFGGTEVSSLRDELIFYAKEGEAYTLYFDPSFGAKSYSSKKYRPLRTDEKTPVLNLAKSFDNPDFNPDFDLDGVDDITDLCPRIADPENKDIDNNGRGDVCEDPDLDNVPSYKDNCMFDYNPNQTDEDADGLGDACDDEENRWSESQDLLLPLVFGLVVVILLGLVWRSLKRTN